MELDMMEKKGCSGCSGPGRGTDFHPQFDFFTLLQGRPNLRSLEDVGEAGLTSHLPSVAGGAP